ncbi:MAG: AMP-binding protein [Rhodoferax sp.]|nr:AMP-binding protein [Rhodoferax sp.]
MSLSQPSDSAPVPVQSATAPATSVSAPIDRPGWDLPPTYQALLSGFQWQVPATFNIAQACCGRWAGLPDASERVAIRAYFTGAESHFYTYAQLQSQANRLSNVLAGLGVARGDRVAIVLPQRFETAVAYMAVLQMGAVAMPLSQLFGPEALAFRLQDSQAVVAIGDEQTLAALASVRAQAPSVRHMIGIGAANALQGLADQHYPSVLAQASDQFALIATGSDDPAILIYTSGTTGNPKGALIPQRALIGNLTGFLCSQNFFDLMPKESVAQMDQAQAALVLQNAQASGTEPLATSNAVFWSPADWAWTGGLMDALLPTLYFGRPIVAFSGRFAPQTALELMRDCGVTHTFLFPTALKAMMKATSGGAGQTVQQQFGLKLQAIMSAGEAVGDAVFAYCQTQLGVTVNEMFGQTEINYIVGNCAPTPVASRTALDVSRPAAGTVLPAPMCAGTSGAQGLSPSGAHPALGRPGGGLTAPGWPPKPGSMGLGYPGHRLAVIDEAGHECAPDEVGEVALHRFDVHGQPDPIFFLGYWRNQAATQAKFSGDWCRTGDLARRDAQGYLWYQGRSDDVFKVAGYRIGPGEIENCLVKHPAVANAAVVPKPDPERGAVVKAYVVLAPDFVTARPFDASARAIFDAELISQLQSHVKGQLAPYEYPKEIEFVTALPMTTTGKVQRRVLRLQEQARAGRRP